MTQESTDLAFPQRVQEWEKFLGHNKSRVAQLVNQRVDVGTWLRVAITSMQRNPLLLDCTRESIMNALLVGAGMGLDFADGKDHLYLVPFKNNRLGKYEATCIVGYKGLMELAVREGYAKRVVARAVYESDHFEYDLGINEKLEHRPEGERMDETDITHVYAIAFLQNGDSIFEVMDRNQVEKIRAGSRARSATAWTEHWEMMARKTVIKRLSKTFTGGADTPPANSFVTAMAIEDRAEGGNMEISDLVPETTAPLEAPAETQGPAQREGASENGADTKAAAKAQPKAKAKAKARAKPKAKPKEPPVENKQEADIVASPEDAGMPKGELLYWQQVFGAVAVPEGLALVVTRNTFEPGSKAFRQFMDMHDARVAQLEG
jgi:recombination protein RecT